MKKKRQAMVELGYSGWLAWQERQEDLQREEQGRLQVERERLARENKKAGIGRSMVGMGRSMVRILALPCPPCR